MIRFYLCSNLAQFRDMCLNQTLDFLMAATVSGLLDSRLLSSMEHTMMIKSWVRDQQEKNFKILNVYVYINIDICHLRVLLANIRDVKAVIFK